jgi:hypothetical protein
MTPPTHSRGIDDAFLCERCGYPLDGQDPDSRCPECSLPLQDSLPERRRGTPWQQLRTVRSLGATAYVTLRRPHATFHSMAPRTDRGTRTLLAIYLSLAALIPAPAWIALRILSREPASIWSSGISTPQGRIGLAADDFLIPHSPLAMVLAVPSLAGVLFVLTWIETLGVRFFGRRRQWRVTAPIAWSVCAHAAIGWVIGGVLHALFPLMAFAASPLIKLLPDAVAIRAAEALALGGPIAAFFAGMLIFESLVYVGVRECRYANVRSPV